MTTKRNSVRTRCSLLDEQADRLGSERANPDLQPSSSEGFLVTQFITVRSVARLRAFYADALGGHVVLAENPLLAAKLAAKRPEGLPGSIASSIESTRGSVTPRLAGPSGPSGMSMRPSSGMEIRSAPLCVARAATLAPYSDSQLVRRVNSAELPAGP
jgi:hypothetical protein